MCGIAGMIDWAPGYSADGLRASGASMNEALRIAAPMARGLGRC